MIVTRRSKLFVINIVLPLVIGLLIYLTKEERTYVSYIFSALRLRISHIKYPTPIKNYACDILWAYSMFFCLRCTLGDNLKGRFNITVVIITSVSSALLELFQRFEFFPGTFDWLDISAELIAILIALSISLLIERRVVYEEN